MHLTVEISVTYTSKQTTIPFCSRDHEIKYKLVLQNLISLNLLPLLIILTVLDRHDAIESITKLLADPIASHRYFDNLSIRLPYMGAQ